MRVGVVTTSFPRWEGDPAGSFVAGHVRWLVEHGHSVEVLAAGGREREERAGERRGVRIQRAPAAADLFYSGGAPETLAADGWRWVSAIGFSAAMTALIARRSRRWDGIIAHWLVPSAAAAAIAGRRRPLVAIAHSGDVHLLCRTGLATPVAGLLRAAGARLVFVSAELRRRFASAVHSLLRPYVEAATVCSMGIDVARFRRAAASRARRPDPGTVLFLGRLVAVKGVDTAIAAAARWQCGARLVVAGDGPEANGLRARAASAPGARVEFLGEVRGQARDRLLADADVLVLPSVRVEGDRSEGMPVVALEAMAARVPVVASRVGGLAELPEDAAFLVPPGDSDALAFAVDRLVSDRGLRERQTRAADALAAQRDWAVIGPVLAASLL